MAANGIPIGNGNCAKTEEILSDREGNLKLSKLLKP